MRCKTLTAACKENLTLMVKRFQQQKKNYPAFFKVRDLHTAKKIRKQNGTELKLYRTMHETK